MPTERDSEIGTIGTIAAIGPLGAPPRSKYDRLIARAKEGPPVPTILAYPCDESSLRGAVEAAATGIIVPILVGPAAKISAVAREHGLDVGRFQIVDAPHSEAAAAKAVELVHEAAGELLMKGSLHTDELMREVASSKTGLRTARRISHVFIMDVPTYSETLFITDAAINIFPDLDAKRDIIQNVIDLFTQVGLGTPPGRDSLRGRDRHLEDSVHHRSGRALQDGRTRADHRRHSRRTARLRQRHRSRSGADQGHQVGGRGACADPGRARSRGRQHAGQEPRVHGQGGWSRPRPRGARADHPDLACGFRAFAPGLLRGRVLYARARRGTAALPAA